MPKDSYTRYPRPILWLIQGGAAWLGGAEDDAGSRFEVEVDSFYISKLPITNEQLEACDPSFERSAISPGDRDPAAGVSHETAQAYCAWYARVSRKPMRLPTEIEWEFACRAGSCGQLFCGDEPSAIDAHIWHRGNSPDSEAAVPPLEAKRANEFGLLGMLGGLWEWTSSIDRPYPPPDGRQESVGGHAASELRVLRGGSFRQPIEEIGCSVRRAEEPVARCDDFGFRIAKSLR